jgi:hypothetical protein
MGFGSFFEDIVSDTVGFIDDAINDTTNFIESAYEDIEDTIKEVGYDIQDELIDPLQESYRDLERSVSDFGKGFEYTWDAWMHGDWKAGLNVIMSIASIGAAAYAMYLWFPVAGTFAGTVGDIVIGGIMAAVFASAIATLTSVFFQYEAIGNAIRNNNMKGLMKGAINYKNDMNSEYTFSWVNSTMTLWMAGGVLYDSPRAGDVMFKPEGNLNTTVFLGMQNRNISSFDKYRTGTIGQLSTDKLAGSMLFAPRKLTVV